MRAQSLILPFCLVIRTWIVILSHAGKSNDEIAAALNLHRNTVGKWRRRIIADGLKGLDDVQRSGRPRTYEHDKVRKTS
ncbi:MAG: helix-turn-helix domain-containing protein [Deltaproteobacteria bacterium]|nr:helix-turn-helix domain-containing protein [Deltaproteobacteria bacterium]